MRSGARSITVLALLLLALCVGCSRRRSQVLPSQQAQAPTVPPAVQLAAMIPPVPSIPAYTPRTVILDTTVPPEPEYRGGSHHLNRRRSKPTEATQQEPAKTPATSEPAPSANAQASGDADVSPIGQLSTANDNSDNSDRQAVINLINSTENGLNGIKRPLSSSEQKTAAQIRAFITHARDSLKTGDLDGARTLATKAHLLLEELTKE